MILFMTSCYAHPGMHSCTYLYQFVHMRKAHWTSSKNEYISFLTDILSFKGMYVHNMKQLLY
jgi:hypothetical protein